MESVTLQIAGMHCEGCAATLRALVEREPGVKAVAVSYQNGAARLLYDPEQTGAERLVAAIGRAGFRVIGCAP
ncbi:MAG TPA: heavy-metal-associated domain-containing protein [Stellaceae bacterium]|nr:heavy-metal-associated domain-containing protein [Stellaceae bacterium]